MVRGLAAKQADVEVEKRGPRVGAPAEALDGFLASLGVSDYKLEEQDDKKGRVHVVRYQRLGRPAADVLAPVLGEILARFPWPKSMRWGAHAVRWVRPLHGILCLLDGAVVPVTLRPADARSASTRGHRFLAPGRSRSRDFEDYRQQLTDAYVAARSGRSRSGRSPARRRVWRTRRTCACAPIPGCSPSSPAWSNGRSCWLGRIDAALHGAARRRCW